MKTDEPLDHGVAQRNYDRYVKLARHRSLRRRVTNGIATAISIVGVAGLLFWAGVGLSGLGNQGERPTASSNDGHSLVIDITPPRVSEGSYVPPRFQVAYRGNTIPVEAIETPGPELEYPSVVAPLPLAAGVPIDVHAAGAQFVAVFELQRATGEHVENGSCIVPGAISSLPSQTGHFAFFIYGDWGDSVGGMAFAANLEENGQSQEEAVSPAPEVDVHALGLAVCDE